MDVNPYDDGLVVIERACQAVIGGCGSKLNNSVLFKTKGSEGSEDNVIKGFWPGKTLLQNLGNSLAVGKYRISYRKLS